MVRSFAAAIALLLVAGLPAEAAEPPKKRTGETIILGQNDVIRVEDMTPIQYRITLSRHARKFRRTTEPTVFFAADSARLTPTAREALDLQAAWIAQHPRVRITITGYTDTASDPRSDVGLGIERARIVARYLVEAGVDRERLIAIQSARVRNARPPRTEAEFAAERRAVTRIVELSDEKGWRDDDAVTAGTSGGGLIVISGSGGGSERRVLGRFGRRLGREFRRRRRWRRGQQRQGRLGWCMHLTHSIR